MTAFTAVHISHHVIIMLVQSRVLVSTAGRGLRHANGDRQRAPVNRIVAHEHEHLPRRSFKICVASSRTQNRAANRTNHQDYSQYTYTAYTTTL